MNEIKLRWKGGCPRHRRFQGSMGRNAVRINCAACDALVDVEEARLRLEVACRRADEKAAELAQMLERQRLRRAAGIPIGAHA